MTWKDTDKMLKTSPGKLKQWVLDPKRSRYPVFIQDLNELLLMVLTKKTEAEVLDRIINLEMNLNKDSVGKKDPLQSKQHSKSMLKKKHVQGKANMSGHVRASLNWNNLKKCIATNTPNGNT